MNIFKQDDTMNRIMTNTKFIKGKRHLPNLRRILMKSEFNENNTPPCVSKCNEPRCGLCKSIIEGSCLKLKDKTFHVKENMNCTVRNVLYVLICNGCKEFYIGQTGDKLRNRKTVHEQQIRDPSTRQICLSANILITVVKHNQNSLFFRFIATNQRVLAAEGCQHESWLLLRLDMLFSVTYPTHFYILGHNFSTVKATSGYWSLEVVSGVFPH